MSNRPKMKRHKKETPIFRDISWLPTIGQALDSMAENSANQIRALERGLDEPYIFDDQVIDRTIRSYGEAIDHCTLYSEQLNRWLALDLEPDQRQEVERLIEVNQRVRAGNERIIDLCNRIKRGTIDRIMEQDDLELGIAALTGKYKTPNLKLPPMAAPVERFEAALAIHELVESVLAAGGGDDHIINHPQMTNFAMQLMSIRISAQPGEMDSLTQMFSGFRRFAMVLENMIELFQRFKRM